MQQYKTRLLIPRLVLNIESLGLTEVTERIYKWFINEASWYENKYSTLSFYNGSVYVWIKFHAWFNYYRKTSIVIIIEELRAWLKVTSFALITGSSPFWSFYAPETGNASGTNKIVQARRWSKRGTEHADCTKDGLVLPVMLFVNPLLGKIICENI